jgi:general secretion pathway protein K
MFNVHLLTEKVPHARRRILRRNDGIALVFVLWILVLLTAIVAEFAYSMRTEVNITRNFKEATQAHYIAQAGVSRTVVELIRNTDIAKNREYASEFTADRVWRVNAPIAPQRFGTGEFSVHIDNAAGLIDLNTAGENLLSLMVDTLDIGDREKDVIVDSILDWRDSDDLHRLNGAENQYYRSLPNPYACKNGAFDAVDELLLVRGMRPELFYKKLKSIVTITPENKARPTAKGRPTQGAARKATGRINVNAAPRRLLEALPQITPEQVQTLIDYRTSGDFKAVAEIRDLIGAQTFSAIAPYINLSLSPFYTIRAEGRVSGSAVRQIIQAMVHIDAALPGGYKIVSWQDRYY